MSIKLHNDQGRSPLEQLQARNRERLSGIFDEKANPAGAPGITDTFQRSRVLEKTEKDAGGLEQKPEAGAVQADGLNISFQFDLFYELTSQVEAKMGSDGANRFVELSGKVSETFMGNFSLSIDPVGSFMNGTSKSLEISPETTSEFFDAVEGLADLSPEALENFLAETDDFFAELEKTYGEADGVFDEIKSQMQSQAKAFFADVEQIKTDILGSGESDATQTVQAPDPGLAMPPNDLSALLPGSEGEDEQSLIEMFFKPGMKLSQEDYQSFLDEFTTYAEKFRQQMFEKLLGSRNPYEKSSKISNDEDETGTKLIDTAV